MHWLFEIFIEAITWLLPWSSNREDTSIVGESRMDRQARWIAWGLILILALGVGAYIFLKTTR